jgi:basic membrane protein A and related proteins
MSLRTLLAAATAATLLASTALADTIKPAVVYDKAGKHDKSFGQSVWEGAQKFEKDSGIKFADFEPQNESQFEQGLRNFAQKGYSPILAVGFALSDAVGKVAKEFPNTHFAIIDSVVEGANVQSIVFKEQEGAYLVGQLAAMASKSGKVGFVGGMDIPLIRRFACGYVGGVKSVNAKAEVLQNMTGTTGDAWNDPVKGGELTKAQIAAGADVVYHAAGATGNGVLQAAADAKILGIGTDANQNYMHPGQVLTSNLKRVDVAAIDLFNSEKDGKFAPGIKVLGLAEGGVGWALDDNNKALITDDMKKTVAAAEADIKSGKLKIHDYMEDSKCPY